MAEAGVAGRGVLLDYFAYAQRKGIKYNPHDTHVITLDELEACRRDQGTEFKKGDILLIRVGECEAARALFSLDPFFHDFPVPLHDFSVPVHILPSEFLTMTDPTISVTDRSGRRLHWRAKRVLIRRAARYRHSPALTLPRGGVRRTRGQMDMGQPIRSGGRRRARLGGTAWVFVPRILNTLTRT